MGVASRQLGVCFELIPRTWALPVVPGAPGQKRKRDGDGDEDGAPGSANSGDDDASSLTSGSTLIRHVSACCPPPPPRAFIYR